MAFQPVKNVRAGDFSQLVDVQQKVQTGTGDRGQPVYNWNTVATVPAYVEPLTGRKLELCRQLVAGATHSVVVRYLAGLDVKHRLLFGSRVFNIGNVNNKLEMNFRQELVCTEQQEGAT